MSGQFVVLSGPVGRERAKLCANCERMFEKDARNTWAYFEKQKYCSQVCAGEAYAEQRVSKRPARAVAFAKWFERTSGCWEWRGATDKDGYGVFNYAGRSFRASRIALELDGRPPGALLACHSCDNPRCVNPGHLFVGSHEENMADMVQKQRHHAHGVGQ
jgi:hypothetical protein